MKNRLRDLEARVIGQIGVDAGIVWVGDPCYIMHRDDGKLPSTVGESWSEFCDTLAGDQFIKSFPYEGGHEGLGVCTSTMYGDGFYRVIGFFERGSKRPSCVVVDFDDVFGDTEDVD